MVHCLAWQNGDTGARLWFCEKKKICCCLPHINTNTTFLKIFTQVIKIFFVDPKYCFVQNTFIQNTGRKAKTQRKGYVYKKNTCVHVNVTLVLSSLHHLGKVIKLVTHTHVDLLIMTVFCVGEKKKWISLLNPQFMPILRFITLCPAFTKKKRQN